MIVRQEESTVLAKASQDNAEATATASAPSNSSMSYNITGVDASFSVSSVSKLLQIKEGTTVIYEQYIHGAEEIRFISPIKIKPGTACSAVLAASGTAGQIGKVNLLGYLV